jgi:hypothetical protein
MALKLLDIVNKHGLSVLAWGRYSIHLHWHREIGL